MKNISHTAFLLQQHSFMLKYRSRILTVPPKQKSSLHLPLHPLHTSKSHFFFWEKINPTFSRKIYPIPFTFHCHSHPTFSWTHTSPIREKLSLSTEIHTFNFPGKLKNFPEKKKKQKLQNHFDGKCMEKRQTHTVLPIENHMLTNHKHPPFSHFLRLPHKPTLKP